jgi:dTMP kinase
MSERPNQPGFFIAIDGPDGSGKGTQTKLLTERLLREGYAAEQVSFPSYGKPEAFFVEQYLNGKYGTLHDIGPKRASLFYALDRHHHASHLRDTLTSGTILISDRYTSSNKGHQTAKISDPTERRAFIDWLNELEYDILKIPKPDLTIFLHVPADIGYELVAQKAAREYLAGKKRDIHESDIAHLKAAETAYLELPAIDTHEHWVRVDCTKEESLLSIEAIHEQLWALVQSSLPK